MIKQNKMKWLKIKFYSLLIIPKSMLKLILLRDYVYRNDDYKCNYKSMANASLKCGCTCDISNLMKQILIMSNQFIC